MLVQKIIWQNLSWDLLLGEKSILCLFLFSLCLLISTGFSFDFFPVYFISFVVFTYWLAFCIYYFKNTSTFMPVQYNHKNSQWSKIYPRYVFIVLDLLVQHTYGATTNHALLESYTFHWDNNIYYSSWVVQCIKAMSHVSAPLLWKISLFDYSLPLNLSISNLIVWISRMIFNDISWGFLVYFYFF